MDEDLCLHWEIGEGSDEAALGAEKHLHLKMCQRCILMRLTQIMIGATSKGANDNDELLTLIERKED